MHVSCNAYFHIPFRPRESGLPPHRRLPCDNQMIRAHVHASKACFYMLRAAVQYGCRPRPVLAADNGLRAMEWVGQVRVSTISTWKRPSFLRKIYFSDQKRHPFVFHSSIMCCLYCTLYFVCKKKRKCVSRVDATAGSVHGSISK
jgi:hypothetical protein